MTPPIPESVRDLAAGYALGALTADEARRFEAALATSPDLASEVSEYREVGALLAALGSGPKPDPALRDRLMARTGEGKRATIAPPRRGAGPLLAVGLAATLLLAAGLGLRNRSLHQEILARDSLLASTNATLAERQRTLDALLTAEADLAVVQLATTGPEAPGVQLFWNRRANVAVLHGFRLRPLAPGRVYQLWLLKDGAPIPSATFTAAADGHALVQSFAMPPGGGFDGAAITEEPEGGSPAPTTPVLLYGAVTGP